MRVLPVNKSLKEGSQILPFDALVPMVEASSYRAVAHCPCRQMLRYTGQGCDHELENCLHFGSTGRYMVEMEMAREITVEETFEILEKIPSGRLGP